MEFAANLSAVAVAVADSMVETVETAAGEVESLKKKLSRASSSDSDEMYEHGNGSPKETLKVGAKAIAPSGEVDTIFIPHVIDKTLILNLNNDDDNNSTPPSTVSLLDSGGNVDVGYRKPAPQDKQELDLQTLYKLPNAHNFYCPSCNCCITKVIILRDDGSSLSPSLSLGPKNGEASRLPLSVIVPTDEEQLGSRQRVVGDIENIPEEDQGGRVYCSNCFSFLVPIGAWISTQLGFGRKEPTTQSQTGGEGATFSGTGTNVPTPPSGDLSAGGKVIGGKTLGIARSVYGGLTSLANSAASANILKRTDHATPSGVSTDAKKPTSDGAGSSGISNEQQPPAVDVEHREIDIPPIGNETPGRGRSLEIVKSIVYGGLTEAITSLGIVTSAASANTPTKNIVALALANLITGLIVITNNLSGLKKSKKVKKDSNEAELDPYEEALGDRHHYIFHFTTAILSFLLFGLAPPLVYGFSFRETDDGDLKLAAVAITSLVCIALLAIGKAYIKKPHKWQEFLKTLVYYITLGFGASGLSYLAGKEFDKLLEQFGWFNNDPMAPTLLLPNLDFAKPTWGSI